MGEIPVRYGYGFSEHKLQLLQGEFSKATVPTEFSDTLQYLYNTNPCRERIVVENGIFCDKTIMYGIYEITM
jgi:hypothetical protein